MRACIVQKHGSKNLFLECFWYLTEIVEDSHALHLFHFAVQATQWDSWPKAFKGLMEEADLLAGRHEYNDLAL